MAKAEIIPGSPAPAFTTQDQDGKKVSLGDFKGKWVVLYFYPKDNTPGCTIEAVDFTKFLQDFKRLNAVVLGVSGDSCRSHRKFIDSQKLKIVLLSDPEHELSEAFGSWAPKKFMGREFMGVVRSTFLIDPNGKIAHAWPQVKAVGHAAEVLKTLKELQRSPSAISG